MQTLLLRFLATLILLLSVTNTVQAEIYKWVDAQGNVHYGQVPPEENTQKIQVDTQTPPPSDTPPASSSPDSEKAPDDSTKQNATETKNLADEQKRAAQKQENCKRAKTRFNTIKQGGRMYEVDEAGERHYWDDAERAAKLSEAQADVDKWCENN